jgi:2'-5' RNA ligase
VDRIRAVLAPAIPIAAFDMSLAGVGTFPTRGAPRVIWAGVARGGDALQAVAKEIGARLTGAGVTPEERTYRPHLTLARVRDAAGLQASTVTEGLAARELGRTRVGAITLFESRLSPQGPTYVPLQHTELSTGTA